MLGVVELIILVVAAVVAVKLYRNPSGSLGKSLLALAGVGFVLVLIAVPLFYLRMRRPEPVAATPVEQSTATSSAAASTVWSNMDQQQFLANVYPSKDSAAIPLARQIRKVLDRDQLLEVAEAEEDDAAVVEDTNAELESVDRKPPIEASRLTSPDFLIVYDNTGQKEVLRKFAKFLQGEFPISEVRYAGQPFVPKDPPESVKKGGVRIVLSAEDEHIEVTASDQPSRQIQGKVVCEITTANGSSAITADYIHKPWVENFDKYLSAQPNQHFVVGHSEKLVSSEEEARQHALRDAQQKYLRVFAGGVRVRVDESLVVDRFAQKLSRPYGDVWREALLFDVSEERLAPLIAAARQQQSVVHRQQTVQRREHFSLVAALAILFGVTVVLCIVLNLLTQGYYRGRLLAGVIVVAGIGLLVSLA